MAAAHMTASAAQPSWASYGKLKQVAPQVLPFVRSLYARVSTYLWWDDSGRCHEIAQAEGVEQGDSLAPALFALGQHDVLAAAARQLEAGEFFFLFFPRPFASAEFLAAFLDGIYVVTSPSRGPWPYACVSCPWRPRAARHTRAR